MLHNSEHKFGEMQGATVLRNLFVSRFMVNHKSSWFKWENARGFWFQVVKLGGLMHRFGDQPRTYYSQNDRLPYSDGNKTMGALVANRRTGSHFLGASSLKNEKICIFPSLFEQKVNESWSFWFNVKNKSICDELFKSIVFYSIKLKHLILSTFHGA